MSKEFEGKVEGFIISNKMDTVKVYLNILSLKMPSEIWQGITKRLYEFYNSNKDNNFIVIIDTFQNHFLVIPFEVLKPVIYEQRSGKDINKNFNISRNPNYHL